MIDDIFFFNVIRKCSGSSAASNYQCHLSRQGSSSKLMTIISFFSDISKSSIQTLRSVPKMEPFIYCFYSETARLTLSSRVSGMSEPKKEKCKLKKFYSPAVRVNIAGMYFMQTVYTYKELLLLPA